ncbi:hypothetical protein BKA70DRAFT_1233647 [Coprinopsis sp. MPI-PUGE-AT-0042]|nr:hypothetical protein BKA70DRAFT_1233647 [Coprinopsis sp. MPI-PUGE-AT-0042]
MWEGGRSRSLVDGAEIDGLAETSARASASRKPPDIHAETELQSHKYKARRTARTNVRLSVDISCLDLGNRQRRRKKGIEIPTYDAPELLWIINHMASGTKRLDPVERERGRGQSEEHPIPIDRCGPPPNARLAVAPQPLFLRWRKSLLQRSGSGHWARLLNVAVGGRCSVRNGDLRVTGGLPDEADVGKTTRMVSEGRWRGSGCAQSEQGLSSRRAASGSKAQIVLGSSEKGLLLVGAWGCRVANETKGDEKGAIELRAYSGNEKESKRSSKYVEFKQPKPAPTSLAATPGDFEPQHPQPEDAYAYTSWFQLNLSSPLVPHRYIRWKCV